jgi:uncharacterized protein YvpB
LTGKITPTPDIRAEHQPFDLAGFSNGKARVDHSVEPFWQGDTNGCGTTSLAIAMNALATLKGKVGATITQEQLDRKRPFDSYTAPGTLVKLAKEHGYFAEQYNGSSFQEIQSHLNNKHLVIALHNAISAQGKPGPLHYCVIHGYQDSLETSQKKLLIADPGRKDKTNNKFELSYDDFCQYWERPRLGPLFIGVQRFIVAVSSKLDLPTPQHRLPVTIHFANFFHNLMNWYAKFFGIN